MRTLHLGLVALGFLATLGCNPSYAEIDRDEFAERSASAWCARLRECSRGEFENVYDDRGDCLDESEDDFEKAWEKLEDRGCDYDEEGAGDYVDQIWDRSCGELYSGELNDDQDLAWDCGR
jgi:hypothetical protein